MILNYIFKKTKSAKIGSDRLSKRLIGSYPFVAENSLHICSNIRKQFLVNQVFVSAFLWCESITNLPLITLHTRKSMFLFINEVVFCFPSQDPNWTCTLAQPCGHDSCTLVEHLVALQNHLILAIRRDIRKYYSVSRYRVNNSFFKLSAFVSLSS